MQWSYIKPENYDTLSTLEKAEVISKFYTRRSQSWQKYNARFFGGTSDFYDLVMNGIHSYLRNYITSDQRPQYRFNSDVIINNNDLNAAYNIVNEFFLSNKEFFSFVENRIKKDTTLSKEFKNHVLLQVSKAENQWEVFSQQLGFNDKDSQTVRQLVKTSAVCCAATSFVCGLGFFSTLAAAASIPLYAVSGELGDSLSMVGAEKHTTRYVASDGYHELQGQVRLPNYLMMNK